MREPPPANIDPGYPYRRPTPVRMTAQQQRRQDLQVAWLQRAIEERDRPAELDDAARLEQAAGTGGVRSPRPAVRHTESP
jgi:hypothetical protein